MAVTGRPAVNDLLSLHQHAKFAANLRQHELDKALASI